MEPSELAASVGDGCGPAGDDGTNDLHPRQGARHSFVRAVPPQLAPQGVGLGLRLNQLHDRRGIQVELQRSSSRIAASAADASIP